MSMNKEEILNYIIKNELIYPVFQPIVSLKDNKIFAYEALSRIADRTIELSITELYEIARKYQRVWELEKICRKKSLLKAKSKPEGIKLFLNVDGNILHEDSFKEGFTKNKINQYGLRPQDVVFEITERVEINHYQSLLSLVNHYQSQGYEIAIDDVGSGYSNLNRIVYTAPKYLKIDMELIRDIHQYKEKRAMVKALVSYCQEVNCLLIAEGVETKQEYICLKDLGVELVQGFYFGKPQPDFL